MSTNASASSVSENLASRHVFLDRYRVFVDEEEGVATFLLWNLSGRIVGYQQYRPGADKTKSNHPRDSRYFTFVRKGVISVFGLETIKYSREIYFVEGVFDAVRLHNEGKAAIALLSNDSKIVRQWIWCLKRPTIAVCDPDVAGRKLAKLCSKAVFLEDFDLGDAPDEFVKKLVRDNEL